MHDHALIFGSAFALSHAQDYRCHSADGFASLESILQTFEFRWHVKTVEPNLKPGVSAGWLFRTGLLLLWHCWNCLIPTSRARTDRYCEALRKCMLLVTEAATTVKVKSIGCLPCPWYRATAIGVLHSFFSLLANVCSGFRPSDRRRAQQLLY